MVRIVTLSDPDAAVLRRVCDPIDLNDITSPEIQRIIGDMSAALRNTVDGIGIAAPQIGIAKRIFIASEEALYDAPKINSEAAQKNKRDWKHFVFINPEIVTISKRKISDAEGCLSVPHTYGVVTRAEKIKIRGYNERGEHVERGASGLFARLFQHEIDHLAGTLFIDNASAIEHIDNPSEV